MGIVISGRKKICRLVSIAIIALLTISLIVFITISYQNSPSSIDSGSQIQRQLITVPDDYQTISDAIGNATQNTIIYLRKGSYETNANPLITNKSLTIIGEDQTNTILVTPPETRTGYETMVPKIGLIVNADNFTICNLTITQSNYDLYVSGNGTKISSVTCSSILVRGSNCQIIANTFRGQSDGDGIGKYPVDISGSKVSKTEKFDLLIYCFASNSWY